MKLTQLVIFILLSVGLFAQQKQAADTFPIEKSIYNIYLQDEATTTKILGANVWNNHFEANGMFPRIECTNEDNTEGLRLFFHYGGTKNAVAEFELFSISKKYKRPAKVIALSTNQFRSGYGIKLGLGKQQLIAVFGENFKVTKENNREELRYYTDNPNAKVLREYGGVAYFIKCVFENGKLVKYNFGFEYP